MGSFNTFLRRVNTGVQKVLPVMKKVGTVAAHVAGVAGPALAGVTGGTSEIIARGVQAANRMVQAV